MFRSWLVCVCAAVAVGLTAVPASTGRFIPVVHECERLVVVDKPPGVCVHDEAGEAGVLTLLRAQRLLRGEGDDNGERLHLCHRLDKPTSGLLILAKGSATAADVAAAFRERRVGKIYVALSAKIPSKKMGTVSGQMAKARRAAWKLLRSQEDAAVTHFAAAGLGADDALLARRLFICRPVTGKTHQIRVALKSLGAPVLGDEYYGGGGAADADRSLYLHATAIRLELPGSPVLQLLCPPSIGSEFTSQRCRETLSKRLFGDDALLQSDEAPKLAPPLQRLRLFQTEAPVQVVGAAARSLDAFPAPLGYAFVTDRTD
mmetsp:Transcript_27255/g.91617  ORF Transcript_27255/g.91617 Transcript_27255/m.91617 type:complete len:317 (-) Transcript_27255:7-957(-)